MVHITLGKGAEATVSVVESTGAEMHIYADHGNDELCIVTDERVALRTGDLIAWHPAVDRVHLFDADTNLALRLMN
jgi:multiple sugar transport system ATP-binding protein